MGAFSLAKHFACLLLSKHPQRLFFSPGFEFCVFKLEKKEYTYWVNWIECEWSPALFRSNLWWQRSVLMNESRKKENSPRRVRIQQGMGEGGRGGLYDAQQCEWNSPSSIRPLCNIFHRRHRSAPGSYTSNQNEPPMAQRDTSYSFEMFAKHFSMFYTQTRTHTHTPTITSVVQRQALCFTSFKLHQTKKQWKLKLR